jgi:hypothetical protein
MKVNILAIISGEDNFVWPNHAASNNPKLYYMGSIDIFPLILFKNGKNLNIVVVVVVVVVFYADAAKAIQ